MGNQENSISNIRKRIFQATAKIMSVINKILTDKDDHGMAFEC
jgi:hypothetical protein